MDVDLNNLKEELNEIQKTPVRQIKNNKYVILIFNVSKDIVIFKTQKNIQCLICKYLLNFA